MWPPSVSKETNFSPYAAGEDDDSIFSRKFLEVSPVFYNPTNQSARCFPIPRGNTIILSPDAWNLAIRCSLITDSRIREGKHILLPCFLP
ncbi:hypothetical protein GUJ93_ZPchr0060g7190 [Zizania palustris]|uniref:Uncharacterized protein n=1 Tax=Zizania palustris TaxID=103762 RepID=A0A8J5R6P0_ZIZPA|nr:hypothetical protein GUJ93_ZPchr2161g7116 [Zizania palustris]KAG8044549.1 hypothetical protein GUJ93_ZPchr0060g7190 [Zizania palustris]